MPTYSWQGSPLWKIWGQTIAAKWAGDMQTIQNVERDPTEYIRNALAAQGYQLDPHVQFVLHNTDHQTVAVTGSGLTYVMPWPAASKVASDVSVLAGSGPPDPNKPGGGGSSGGGSSGGGGGDCCCCSCVCCCC